MTGSKVEVDPIFMQDLPGPDLTQSYPPGYVQCVGGYIRQQKLPPS